MKLKLKPESILLVGVIMCFALYFFVFVVDWTFVIQTFLLNQEGAPAKEEVLVRLEGYKRRTKKYPNDLGRIGIKNRYGSILIAYVSNGKKMEVCYHFFPYLGGMTDCFDSDIGVWETR